MKLTLYRLKLPLAHPFTIARGSISTQHSLVVELEHDGARGLGEVTEDDFYGHSFDTMTKSLQLARPLCDEYLQRPPSDVWPEILSATNNDTFATSALDMAAHDLFGKRNGKPTWENWNLTWDVVPHSSFTIGIDTVETMVAKLGEQSGWSVYKIKLGTAHDIDIVTELRHHTESTFRVDANCGWTAEETIKNSKALADLGVEFIEQPLPIQASRDDKRRVYESSALPIIADEDCQTIGDVEKCNGLYHGVNVKICKCGGLTPALTMLRKANRLGMKTMVGCMVESSIGISGAAQLLPVLDYADLDGAVLLRSEPATGAVVDHGLVRLSGLPGCGASLDQDRLDEYLIDR